MKGRVFPTVSLSPVLPRDSQSVPGSPRQSVCPRFSRKPPPRRFDRSTPNQMWQSDIT